MQLFLTDPLLDNLNDEQKRAVTSIDGTVQVVASAGSGKTTVLTRRIAYMLHEGIRPESILAVTFTKKAATEMQKRLKTLVSSKKEVENIFIGTYHSFCLNAISEYAKDLGFSEDKKPSLCLESRQSTIIRNILNDIGGAFLSEEVVSLIGQIKNMGILPEQFEEMVSNDESPIRSVGAEKLPVLAEIYKKYQTYLLHSNIVDFDDLLLLTLKLLRTSKIALKELQDRYKYVLVDEFQDVNSVQYEITKRLAMPQNNLFVVGDDAQSIYEFRGSDVGIILNFVEDYPNTKMIKLENNYRSTPEIIDISNKLIKFNRHQIQKNVKAIKPNIYNSVNFFEAEDVTDESYFGVAKQIKEYIYKGVKPQEIAVLYRNHSQANYLEEDLVTSKIPYNIQRSGSFYDLPEIQNIFAYLRLASGKVEYIDEAFERIFRLEGINSKAVETLRTYARNNGLNMLEVVEYVDSLNIHPVAKSNLKRLTMNVFRWKRLSQSKKLPELIEFILEDSSYLRKLEEKNTESAYNSINNLSIIHNKAIKWNCENIDAFFSQIEQNQIKQKESKGKKDAVQLMTIHSAKGMEFDIVFIIGMEEDILPHKKSVDIGNVSEERRLCYVALTRARKYLHISRVLFRNRFGKRYKTIISRFLQEITDQVTL